MQILEIGEGGSKRDGASPDNSIAVALARHGIKPTVRTSIAGEIGVGDEILSRLTDMGADLLVMGAYGHSRMRELVFGGVTRHIARHMTVPTLLSHCPTGIRMLADDHGCLPSRLMRGQRREPPILIEWKML